MNDKSLTKASKSTSGKNKKNSPNQIIKATELKGFEIIGRKNIPYVREFVDDNYIVTTYGSQNAASHTDRVTLLTRHERRGRTSWGIIVNGWLVESRKAMNIAQNILQTKEGRRMYMAIKTVKMFPEKLSALSPHQAGRIIHDAIQRDIEKGNPYNTGIIAKCIESLQEPEVESRSQLLLNCVEDISNNLGRIPIKEEVQKLFEERLGHVIDHGNFSKEIARIGLKWLPVKLSL